TIRYYNTLNTPLGDVTLTLTDPGTGTALATTTTNPTGEYIFDQVCPGNYNIEITNSQQMQSINSTDAGQVNAWNVAQLGNTWPSIEKVRFLAGDVTGDNYVDSG